jgi:arginine decarboxylase
LKELVKNIGSDRREVERNYFTIAQMRYERWQELLDVCKEMRKHLKNGIEKVEKQFDAIHNDITLIEQYFGFPGLDNVQRLKVLAQRREIDALCERVDTISKLLINESYRYRPQDYQQFLLNGTFNFQADEEEPAHMQAYYFETLVVDDISAEEEAELRHNMADLRDKHDPFFNNVVVARSFQDALIALEFNYKIQAVVIRYDMKFASRSKLSRIKPFIYPVLKYKEKELEGENIAIALARAINKYKPQVDLYYVTNFTLLDLSDEALHIFRRIFYRKEDLQELHLSINRGLKERFEAPFYSALVEYSQKPTSVFHAMPISRGNSVFKSFWIREMGEFYGRNLFLAETSATTGGLDSLLQPTGPLKLAQEKAAKAFGSRQTYFVTNGTSTANKIVQQALVQPGDYVLIDRDCHKSHHYGLVLAGGFPIYLDSYPIQKYGMYGAVPLSHIKEKLLLLKEKNMIDRVSMLVLTNCTFDGLVYNVERVMEEVLAIKPDMIFLWDEAWFGFASFTYSFRKRTAMYVAQKLDKKYNSPEYLTTYQEHIATLGPTDTPKLPNPKLVKIRVYSTQSTHKTLTSLRQGSMIHIHDVCFAKKRVAFLEAYMTHTSTSANYQILASLDVGRRQVQFEGFEMVEKSVELAMILRAKINDHQYLKKYFDVLTIEDFIPKKHRKSGLNEYYDPKTGWNRLEAAWEIDEFVLDPTKINLFIGRTGVDGDTFKNRFLMDKFNIQINKTSRNTVLFMTNIGTTRGSVAYLVGVLSQIARELEEEEKGWSRTEEKLKQRQIKALCEDAPSLPDFSRFHDVFRHRFDVPGGDIRSAYYLAYEEDNYDFIPPKKALNIIRDGQTLVSAVFVIPYPPGFPILVPGQIISEEILSFLLAIDVKEVHGYRADLGLQVFTAEALEKQALQKIPNQ